jgi:glucose-1-phosphate adenylyltransferase
MGIYIAEIDFLRDILTANSLNPDTGHDFGYDVISALIQSRASVYGYNYADNDPPGQKKYRGRYFWADVGTIDSYFSANMELVAPEPEFNLYTGGDKDQWPFYSATGTHAPVKINDQRLLINSGCITEKSRIFNTVLSHDVHIFGSDVENVIAFRGVSLNGCRIKNAIIEDGNHIPSGIVIGDDYDADKALGIQFDERSSGEFKVRIVPRGLFPAKR